MERLFHAWLAVSSFFVRTDDEEGATAVEYGVMVAFIAVGIITAVTFLRDQLIALFTQVGNALN